MDDRQSMPGAGDIRRDITLRLTVLARHLRKQFDQRLEGQGITRSQWTLVAAVARRPGTTQRTIAEVLDISEAAAGRLVDKLCAEGLLERQAKEDDRRAYRIVLTAKARPILDQMGTIASAQEARVFEGFSDGQLEQLRVLLDAMYVNLNR